MLSVPVIRPVSRFSLRVLSNTGPICHFLAFAFSMAAVIGAFDSNPVFVTICGSLAPVSAILGLFAKRLTLWRTSRRREDPEADFDAVVQDDPWARLAEAEVVSSAISSTSLCASTPDVTDAISNPWVEEASLRLSSTPPLASPSPMVKCVATKHSKPAAVPIKGIEKLSGYTRWRARMRFLVRQNGWALSEEWMLEGPKHMPTWLCRLRVNEVAIFEGRSAQRKSARENAAEAAVSGLVNLCDEGPSVVS